MGKRIFKFIAKRVPFPLTTRFLTIKHKADEFNINELKVFLKNKRDSCLGMNRISNKMIKTVSENGLKIILGAACPST